MRDLLQGLPLPPLLLVHGAATWFLTGLVWLVQLVHYPLMGSVGRDSWTVYHREHCRRITFVVLPAMVLELAAALLLAARSTVAGAPAPLLAWTGLLLLAMVWLSTFALQVPLHARLQRQFDEGAWRRLVATNWLRTAAWSARALLALGLWV